ncbi:probable serine/threonine-protein kinase MARK-C isoform X2 [Anopheles gambiae]|uniref:Protein kinase domain-containing protein n=1 Tax=Anopheles coluzzii TaxID=1518534 RepID=A0A6E8WDZ2_ANOCL|nr:probable serine/threonine-protein kinase MARK-C isoform X1 [Anopheles coluzzii]XP_040235492.2 probable serine/threonine-protein kinase MARK-C isoform X1 [Anopheles coluzzii]XP_061518337.1 probable serine/threonine-protein kinase MARK-C isoform X2 [Anopheles gambiae]
MIHVDETDPLGDIPPAFPYREVEIKRGIDPKQIYELSSELGRGKFGVVYKCKEKSTGVRLAAKFIQIVKKGDRRNIEREVHMMNVLHHSKIAQLYAAYEFDRTFCVMMELVEGGELFDRVLDEKFVLTEKACSIFMRQICDAVAYIHGNNIIHLDMKPENILCLTESGNRIKIIDFGLAREYDPDNKLQVLFGTPEFVAPEVVNFEAISFATDMWSVGVIAYVLVSGLSPFAGEDDIQTMGNITIGRYDFLDEAFDNVSEEAIDFINRCLVKEQKERLTAEDALKHKWIKRKPQYHPTNRRPSLTNSFKPILLESNNNSSNVTNAEIAKDNLKELVGKWDETPNNRYAFEQDTENIIAPSGETVQLRRPTLPELAGLANGSNTSGSRRGSIARVALDVNEDAESNAENEAPNQGSDSNYNVHRRYDEQQTKHQQHHYDPDKPPIVLELTQQTRAEAEESNASDSLSLSTNTFPATNSERFDSCQRSVTSNSARYDEAPAVQGGNAASGGSSRSICSSDSNGSISSYSSLEERAPTANQQMPACANTDGGLEPASKTIVIVVQQPHPVPNSSPHTNNTHTDTNASNGRPNRTSVSSDFLSADSDSVASSCDTTASVCTDPAPSPTTPLHLLHPGSPAQPNPPRTVGSAGDGDAVTDTHRDKALDGVEQSALNASTVTTPTTPAPALELDSELESLKSKVNTIRTSRAQNKLNELAQRPDFLANDPFKLPTFRFLPKSISLCNEDSVFKENYTKFCDRNASGRLSREQSQETTVSEKIDTVGTIVRKKSTTSSTTKKKKDPEGAATATTTTTTTTTFSSTPSGKIASTTTVRKTIVKQQKIVVEDASSSVTTVGTSESSRSRSIAPTKSLDVSSSSTALDSSKLTHSASIKRTKFRVNQLSSRDVPVAINSVARRYLERSGIQDDLSTSAARLPRTLSPTGPGQTTLDDTVTVNNLRNSALRLRSSVSVDWDAMEAVENRSMKTINTFLKRHAVASSAVKQIQAQLEATITTHK